MKKLLDTLGLEAENLGSSSGHDAWHASSGPQLVSFNPTTGARIAAVQGADDATYEAVLTAARSAPQDQS